MNTKTKENMENFLNKENEREYCAYIKGKEAGRRELSKELTEKLIAFQGGRRTIINISLALDILKKYL